MRSTDRLVVVTPWYPTAHHPYLGVFIRQWIRSLQHDPDLTTIVHAHRLSEAEQQNPVFDITTVRDDLGTVVTVPYDVPSRTARPDAMRLTRDALRRVDPSILANADVIHAHVGMPTAVAVAPLVPDGVPFTAIEHASYLSTVLQEPPSREAYAALLKRADQLLMVGEYEARRLRDALPQYRQRVTAVGNPIDGDAFPLREHEARGLDKWLYVGNVLEEKGMGDLLHAFARFRKREPGRDSTLTVVGGGHQPKRWRAMARRLGIADRVDFREPVESEQLSDVYHEADVLVHLSHGETFGLSVLEAAISGLPVVVTRCGGPEETLRFASAAGRAQFVPVEAHSNVVVDAVLSLEQRLEGTSASDVRAQILHRFGMVDFGRRVVGLSSKVPVYEADGVQHSVVMIATGPRGADDAMHASQTLLRAGSRVRYLTAERGDARVTDRRIDARSMWACVEKHPVRRLERLLLGAPRFGLRSLGYLARMTSRIGGPLRTPASKAYWMFVRTTEWWNGIAAKLHADFFDRHIYQRTSGQGFVAFARASWPDLVSDPPDLVVYADPKGAGLAEEIAANAPGAQALALPPEDDLERIAHEVRNS